MIILASLPIMTRKLVFIYKIERKKEEYEGSESESENQLWSFTMLVPLFKVILTSFTLYSLASF